MKVRKTGFTVIELLIVIAIIAILASIAVPAILDYLAQSEAEVAGAESGAATQPGTPAAEGAGAESSASAPGVQSE